MERWTREKLKAKDIPISDLTEDFKTGINLLHLLEVVTGANMGKIDKVAKMQINMMANVNKVIQFLKDSGIRNIHSHAERAFGQPGLLLYFNINMI